MKKPGVIIPCILLVLLGLAWVFRWEKGPTQSLSNVKVVHIKDRWTNQAWITLYGMVDGQFYSGYMRPIISNERIQRREEQIQAIPEQVQKRQELENKVSECENIKSQFIEGHNSYERLIKLAKEHEHQTNPFKIRSWDFTGGLLDWEKYHSQIPPDIQEAEKAWQNAELERRKAISELENQTKWIHEVALTDLRNQAWRYRNLGTAIWAVLTALFLAYLIYTFYRTKQDKVSS